MNTFITMFKVQIILISIKIIIEFISLLNKRIISILIKSRNIWIFIIYLSLKYIEEFLHLYYINIIFYSFISMFGPIAIYRVMNDVYPAKKWQLLIAVFLIPSFLFWCSGIHKDGLIFSCTAVIVFHLIKT